MISIFNDEPLHNDFNDDHEDFNDKEDDSDKGVDKAEGFSKQNEITTMIMMTCNSIQIITNKCNTVAKCRNVVAPRETVWWEFLQWEPQSF